MTSPERIRLTAIGIHLPETRVPNLPAAAALGITEDALQTKIGIHARVVKQPEQRTSDLCVEACDDLLRNTNVDLDAIQLLCVVTQNPDQRIPHTAAIVHEKLGLPSGCMTFDLSQGCAGYTHGLATVTALADRYGFEHVLLCTCDPYSTVVDPHDRNTALLFGDAATVSYLTTGVAGYRIVDGDFGTAPGTTSVLHCSTEHLTMDGRGVFLNAAREGPRSVERLLDRNGLRPDEVDLYLVHPGSKRIVDVVREEIGVDETRLPFEIAHYGNTVSSSLPLMLAPRLRTEAPATVLLAGFGVGFTWGTSLIRYIRQERSTP